MADNQYVTLVAIGGSPIRLADQNGAPYATTGYGPLVFANGPTLTNATLVQSTYSIHSLELVGAVTGSTFVQPQDVASGTLTLPAATDTLVGRDTVDTLTNKSMDGLDNTFKNLPAGSFEPPFIFPARTVAASFVAVAASDFEVMINFAGAVAVTLPVPSGVGHTVRVSDISGAVDIGVNVITVSGNGIDPINGATGGLAMEAAYESTLFRWNGTGWNTI